MLPKRESSRRKAKENSSTRRIMQERLLEDDEELPGLDLTDSDDDATWTPFKEKGDKSGASKPKSAFLLFLYLLLPVLKPVIAPVSTAKVNFIST